jgi:hypothetical protein
MGRHINVQTKIIRELVLIHVFLVLFSVANASVISDQKSVAGFLLKSKKTSNNTVSYDVIAEQDPNGIYWGLRNIATGKLVLKYTFEEISDFKDGFAIVLLNGKYGLVNKFGKVIIEPTSDSPNNMEVKCGLVSFEVGYGPIAVIDIAGRSVMPAKTVTGILLCKNRITLENKGYGMMDFKNHTILPFKFSEAYLLPEGFCVASTFGGPGSVRNDLYGLYDMNGKQVLPHEFERIDGFYSERAIVKKNGKYGVIDPTGKELFYTDYGRIDRFVNDYALVYTNPKDGERKVGAINKNGKVVVPAIYQGLERTFNFKEGMVSMGQNRKYGFLDTSGKVVVNFKYDNVEPFDNGIAKVWVGWKYAGYINKNGNEIIPPDFEAMDQANLRRYHDKYIIGSKGSTQHVFNYSGKEVAVLNYKQINEVNDKEKSFLFLSDNKYGLLDSNLQVKIPAQYQSLELVFPGKIAARQQGKVVFINMNGKLISPAKYDLIESFHNDNMGGYENGLAKVRIQKKKGLINSYAKVIVPVIYDEIESFSNGLAVVKRNGKYGFVNSKGKEVIPAIYNKANAYDGYSAEVVIKGKTVQIDRTGKRVDEDIE